jgi:hypothetical protein
VPRLNTPRLMTCLPAHGRFGGMSSEDIDLARAGSSVDPKRAAVARFARRVVDTRGQVSPDIDIPAVDSVGAPS